MNRTLKSLVVAGTAALALGSLAACSSGGDNASAAGSSSSSSASASSSPSSTPSSTPSSASASASPSKSSSSPGKSTQAAKTATITIKDFKYSGPSSVAPGTKIVVKNDDSEAHTVTADSGGAFNVNIPPGTSASFTAPKAGSYPFHCIYHSNMHGTLKVS